MKEKDFECAELVYNKLCMPSDCYDDEGKLLEFDYVVAIDDDISSAIHAVRKAREIAMATGHYPKILCVGGKGILSRYLYDKSEAKVLADVCFGLKYRHDLVRCKGMDTGKNTPENLKNLAKHVLSDGLQQPRILICVTKRQSLRYVLAQRKLLPNMFIRWFVIDEPLLKACRLDNAKSLCDNEMMLHELAAILPRCEEYAGISQEPIPFKVSPEVRKAADYLAKRYRLKIGGKLGLMDKYRYAKLYVSLILHKKEIKQARKDMIWVANLDENFRRKDEELIRNLHPNF